MNNNAINKAYVSPYDEFYCKFDAEHAKTPSQLKEIKKHQRIANLRDNPNAEGQSDEIWESF